MWGGPFTPGETSLKPDLDWHTPMTADRCLKHGRLPDERTRFAYTHPKAGFRFWATRFMEEQAPLGSVFMRRSCHSSILNPAHQRSSKQPLISTLILEHCSGVP